MPRADFICDVNNHPPIPSAKTSLLRHSKREFFSHHFQTPTAAREHHNTNEIYSKKKNRQSRKHILWNLFIYHLSQMDQLRNDG